ncbi:hypothetical protein AFCA_001000 [Aspergillus flavus]|uniref:Unnamed protein product n=4 Tax=Aspergillus subgen. Circumdati TaxID=2720871 RepID=A0AAN4YHZ9_ASPOZ|nr:hypothetical protein AFLA70_120g002382 [Aspergillus flavus AF70]UCK58130.1 hypothetical protein AFCA_001000 [Aspergillus flavus]GMF71313.1 unnamed protein product [Aspergillus oryzae]GMG45528.1 unnamed protein product [Aspergillus oryzae var. brunneus]GMF87140.1 unnamed protein product [Aspergillus oryzae]
MMPTSLPTMVLNSPKPKRSASEESDSYSPSISSPSSVSAPSLPEVKLREEEELGRYSPRAAVAGRLGQLAIRGDHFPTPQFLNGNTSQSSLAHSAQSGCWATSYSSSYDMSETNSATETNTVASGPAEAIIDDRSNATPTPFPKKQATQSPRKRRNPPKTQRPRRKSPPPTSSAADDSLTWHDSEITGHDPNDPNDDGYGINGIGFKPTAAMAWNRSQKRQKQLAEWKSREAREARERRREKRDAVGFEKLRTIQSGAIHKRVKFDV